MSKSNSRRSRHLAFEGLERRQLLAGNVSAGLDVNGNLVLSGDLNDNHVVVTRGFFSGTLLVTGGRSVPGDSSTVTRINGETTTQSFSTSGGLILNMSDGSDRVLLTNVGLIGNVTGSLGNGSDQLAFESDDQGPLPFTLNNGNEPNFGNVSMSGLVNVNGNDGNDSLVMFDAIIGGNLTFAGGGGNDLFNSSGTDTDDNVVGGSVQLTPGTGNDSISIFRLAVGANFRVDDGSAATRTNVGITNLRANLDILLNLSVRQDVVTLRGESSGVRFQARNVTINTGEGWDNVRLEYGTMTNLTLSTGNGNEGSASDTGIRLNFLGIGTSFLLDTGDGIDTAFLGNITVDSLRVDMRGGTDRVVANNLNVQDAIFTTLDGDDFVGLHESNYDELSVFLGDDDDVLQVRNLDVDVRTTFDGGLGFNTLQNQGGNTFRRLTRTNI
jgi:hypothetical protein